MPENQYWPQLCKSCMAIEGQLHNTRKGGGLHQKVPLDIIVGSFWK